MFLSSSCTFWWSVTVWMLSWLQKNKQNSDQSIKIHKEDSGNIQGDFINEKDDGEIIIKIPLHHIYIA